MNDLDSCAAAALYAMWGERIRYGDIPDGMTCKIVARNTAKAVLAEAARLRPEIHLAVRQIEAGFTTTMTTAEFFESGPSASR